MVLTECRTDEGNWLSGCRHNSDGRQTCPTVENTVERTVEKTVEETFERALGRTGRRSCVLTDGMVDELARGATGRQIFRVECSTLQLLKKEKVFFYTNFVENQVEILTFSYSSNHRSYQKVQLMLILKCLKILSTPLLFLF